MNLISRLRRLSSQTMRIQSCMFATIFLSCRWILGKYCCTALFQQYFASCKSVRMWCIAFSFTNLFLVYNIHLVPYCSFLFLSNQIYVYMIETMSFLAVTTYETMTSHSERRQVIPLKHKGMGIFRSLIFVHCCRQ
jgi:hypothetical protein